MAEETARCLPDSPDVNRSWRRISTRKLSFLYTEETFLPNYLRSPTGSCHDACKYGRKHESEEDKKPRVSPLKRVSRSFSGTLSFDSPLRKKKALTKSVLSSSLGSDGGCEHDEVSRAGHFSSRVCDVKKQQNAERSRQRAVSLSDSKRKKTVSHSFKATVVSRRRALEMVEHDKRVTALKLKSVAQTAAMALRRSTVNRKKVDGGSEASSEPKKVVVPLRVTMSSKRVSRSLKTKKESNNLSSVPLKRSRKRVDDKCKDLVEEKTLYVIKMNTGNETVASDQNQRCVMDPPIDDSKSEKCQDETECVVTEANDEFPQEGKEEVDEAIDETPPQEEEEEADKNVSFYENKNTTRQGKSKPLSTESSINGKSMRLKFKRGKVLDVVGSQDNNSPRKLKFKRGKIVTGEDTSSKTSSQRSLNTKETDFSNDKEQQHKPKPLEVVLKHQEETEKKSDSSRALLFNNVIEETANKLVETRKSKVKALVGAFESVISLQERNSSPTTTT